MAKTASFYAILLSLSIQGNRAMLARLAISLLPKKQAFCYVCVSLGQLLCGRICSQLKNRFQHVRTTFGSEMCEIGPFTPHNRLDVSPRPVYVSTNRTVSRASRGAPGAANHRQHFFDPTTLRGSNTITILDRIEKKTFFFVSIPDRNRI